MSVCKSLACRDCKKYLWIGQTTECLYTAEPDTMEALRVFLFSHEDHPLTFTSNNIDGRLDDYEEVSPIPSPAPGQKPSLI